MVSAIGLLATAIPARAEYNTMPRVPSPTPGTVSLLRGTFPNYYFRQGSTGSSAYTATEFADVANHLYFEANVYGSFASECPGHSGIGVTMAAYDLRTTQLHRFGCPSADMNAPGQGNEKNGVHTVDSRRRVIFTGADVTPGNSLDGTEVEAISEDSLSPVGTWTVPLPGPAGPAPSAAATFVDGLDYSAKTSELFVTFQYGPILSFTPSEPLLGVTAYSVTGPPGAPRLAPEGWALMLPQCARDTDSFYGENNPVRSQVSDAVLVSCRLSTPTAANNGGGALPGAPLGIVRVPLSAAACPGNGHLCGAQNVQVTPVPGPAQDAFFDPGSERGFVPTSDCGEGCTVLIYDGLRQAFIGRTSIGDPADQNAITFGVDPTTGRFYGFGQSSGLTVLDGRRTPVSVGVRYAQFRSAVEYVPITVVPPTDDHPFTRVLAPLEDCVHYTGCEVPGMSVFADLLPLSADPPPSRVDQNTYPQTIPPGTPTSATYSADARGYGYHSTWAGSYGGAASNSSDAFVPSLPAPGAQGYRDILGGAVPLLTAADGTAQAMAAAVADGNGTTAQDMGKEVGGQTYWPAPPAACTSPGGNPSASSVGLRNTDGSQLGDASTANASVACDLGGTGHSATGRAALTGAGAQNPAAAVAIGQSGSSSSVIVPRTNSNDSVKASAEAFARGIDINLPGGSLHLGSVEQTAAAHSGGGPRTASATRQVQVSDVAITAGGQEVRLCEGVCETDPQGLAAQINSAFPGLIHVEFPPPDDRFRASGYGSPGGYQAVIQASPAEEYGDQQFNGMPAGESTFLPGMRIVLYDDGRTQLDREVLDLAGVQVDTQLGRQPLTSGEGAPPPDLSQAAALAGLPQPGRLGTVDYPPSGLFSTPGGGGGAGWLGSAGRLVERAFDGLTWLMRRPAELLQMLGAVAVLGLPLLAMDRRRLWIRDIGRVSDRV